MAYPIAKRITLNLIAEIIVAVVTVMLAIGWMASKQNQQAEATTRTMVVGGIEALEETIKAFANDYAWWEPGYEGYAKGDATWVNENFGSGIVDTQVTDLLAIISPKGKLEYAWAIDNDHGTPQEIYTPAVIGNIQEMMRDVPVANEARSGYLRVGNDILLLAVARLTPVSRAAEVDRAILPYIVQAIYLNQTRLDELGGAFLIDDLHLNVFDEGETAAPDAPLIHDLDGNAIAAFDWTPPNSGYVVLRRVLAPVSAALAIFCVFALAAAYRTRGLAVRLAVSEARASVAARTDSLTGLMNRDRFTDIIESEAYRELCAAGQLAMIFIDVNGFKAVNDSIGHNGGDEMVKALAERLASALPSDTVFARIGGDEFAVAVVGPLAREMVAGAAASLVHSIDKPFIVHGFEFHLTASVGYAIGGPNVQPEELLRRADIAMYQAKNSAERDAVVYHATMETGALEKKQIEKALRKGIENNELSLVYQPVVRAGDLSLVSLEALVRWTSPELGTVSPAVFVPVAEDAGLIHDLGRFVVRQVCQDFARWPTLKVAVNISPVQLRDPNFVEELRQLVEEHGIKPQQLELELTEGILVNNPAIAKRKLESLKALGFGLSIDDFGTGFSSIGYLRQFPFDKLKIDRSFVREIGISPTANALIQALVSLGDALDLSVTAEGIENKDQLSLLRVIQCELIQGFYISKPISAGEMTDFIERGAREQVSPSGGLSARRGGLRVATGFTG
jgi:diguanylate cyclase (GGDEF)-like protein